MGDSLEPLERPRSRVATHWLGAGAAGLCLLLLAVPLVLLTPFSRVTRVRRVGRAGRPFRMWLLLSRDERSHPLRARFGVAYWLALLNVARGDLGWVGPRALASLDELPAAQRDPRGAVRPGLMCLWSLRRRTLIDYGSEWDADLEYLRTRGIRKDLGIVLRHACVALIAGLPEPCAASDDVTIVDVKIDNLSMGEAVARIRAHLDADGPPAQICFVNPACVNIAARHRQYRDIIRRAALVLPDGIGIKMAGDLLATPLRQNVNGTDLFPRLCTALEGTGHGVYLLGGKPGVAEAVARHIAARYPGVSVSGYRDGYFDPRDAAATRAVVAAVRASGARLILVAMGVPVQEQFIARHLDALGVGAAIGVGGLFDFVSGAKPRAPVWLRELGGEWLFRLAIEPGRMWKRYLIGNLSFLGRVMLQQLGWRRRIVCRLVSAEAFAPTVAPSPAGRRCVLFATRPAPDDFPAARGIACATLPVGATTALEQVLGNLAGAGCMRVDLVVSDAPDGVRALVGDGRRWGLDVHLHLSASTSHPYAWLIRGGAKVAGEAVLIGHADVMPDVTTLARLFERPALLVEPGGEGGVKWLGWGGVTTGMLTRERAPLDRDALFQALAADLPLDVIGPGEVHRVDSIACWRQTQAAQLADVHDGVIPPHYRAHGWGGQGAHCRIAPDAVIRGPALIGERCMIGAGVEIGPNVIIGDDVVVGTGTSLRDTTVLSGVYVGAGLSLDGAIVGEDSLYSARWRARLTFRGCDAVIAPLIGRTTREGPGRLERAAAGIIVAMLAPLAAVLAATHAWRTGKRVWIREDVVAGWNTATGSWVERPIRVLRQGHGPLRGAVLSAFGGALDIVDGARCWIGPRPRSATELAMLPRDWQILLGGRVPGWLNTRVMIEEIAVDAAGDALPPEDPLMHEIRAAADLYGIVRRGRLGGWGMRGMRR